jgi:hypothetical protein
MGNILPLHTLCPCLQVGLADKNKDAVDALVSELGGDRALALPCDVTNRDSVGSAVAETVRKFGTLNGCINCAGIGSAVTTVSKDLKPMDPRWWEFVMKINADGTFYSASHCAAGERLGVTYSLVYGGHVRVANVSLPFTIATYCELEKQPWLPCGQLLFSCMRSSYTVVMRCTPPSHFARRCG